MNVVLIGLLALAMLLGAVRLVRGPTDADRIVAAFGRVDGDAQVPVSDAPMSVERLEWEHIQRVLAEHGGNVSATARALQRFFPRQYLELLGRDSITELQLGDQTQREMTVLFTDIVYSVYDPIDGLDPCDVNQWHTLSPITYAHDDPLMSAYGISKYPFRDSENNPITPGTDIHGTYPWIDRQGNNLFFTTVDSTNYYADGAAVRTRYPASCVTPGCIVPTTAATIDDVEYGTEMRGVAFTGLWSHGKTVLLDNAMNNIDFGLHRDDEGQRFLALFAPGTEPPGVTPPAGGVSGQVRAGTGRDNSTLDVPVGMTENSTFIDSAQNLWNHDPHLQTATPRDVVWTLNTGRGSAEVAFDDYLDESAFIISESLKTRRRLRDTSPVSSPATSRASPSSMRAASPPSSRQCRISRKGAG